MQAQHSQLSVHQGLDVPQPQPPPPLDDTVFLNSRSERNQMENFFSSAPAVSGHDATNDVDNASSSTCEVKMEEFALVFSEDLSLYFMQASASSFAGVKHDVTGSVLWGASLCLADYLVENPKIVQHQRTLELGCGCGLPSLVSCKLGASDVIATDFDDSILHHVDRLALRNGCTNLELYKLDWKDSLSRNTIQDDVQLVSNVILGSDIIYSPNMVPALVATIDRFLASTGTAYLALRDSREGVAEFLQNAMPEAGFVEVHTVACPERPQRGKIQGLQNAADQHRFHGQHVIHVFHRQQ